MGCRKLSYYEGEGSEEKSPLKIFCGLEEKNDSSIFCIDYSPFGLSFNSYKRTASTEQNFKYNGKELMEETGWYSYGFRIYDPSIGRFPSVDPIADQFVHVSPYNYAENEPVGSIDLWGLQRLQVNGRERTNAASNFHRDVRTGGAALRHPIAASRTGQVERGGTNISSVSGRIARHAGEGGNMSTGIGSERNALRHGIWSATMASEFGAGITSRITNAHEGIGIGADVDINMNEPFSGNADFADDMVDLLNNEIGIAIGEGMEGATAGDIANAIINVFETDGLWTSTTDEDGNVTISRQTISADQAQTARDRVNTLDDNGMNQADRDELENEN